MKRETIGLHHVHMPVFYNWERENFWWPLSELKGEKLVSSFENMLKVFTDESVSEVFYKRVDGEVSTIFY